MKVARKVNQGCTAAPICLDNKHAGWESPSAEALYAQEMWASYHQFLQNHDDLATMVRHDLTRLLTDKGCTTLRELQEELLLHPPSHDFYSRFTCHLGNMGAWMGPPSQTLSVSPSLAAATRPHCSALATTANLCRIALARIPKIKRNPCPAEKAAKKALDAAQLAKSTFSHGLSQLHNQGVTQVSQIISNTSGALLQFSTVPGKGSLNKGAYTCLLTVLRIIPIAQRVVMHTAGQPYIRAFSPSDEDWFPDLTWQVPSRRHQRQRKKTNPNLLPTSNPNFAFSLSSSLALLSPRMMKQSCAASTNTTPQTYRGKGRTIPPKKLPACWSTTGILSASQTGMSIGRKLPPGNTWSGLRNSPPPPHTRYLSEGPLYVPRISGGFT